MSFTKNILNQNANRLEVENIDNGKEALHCSKKTVSVLGP